MAQVRQSPVPVHEPAAQAEGHSIQVVLPSQTRGAVQQLAAVVHVRQLPGVVSQVEHGEVQGVQTDGAVKRYPEEQQLLPAVAQVKHSPVPVHEAQAEGHSMHMVRPFQTRGAVQQSVRLLHVRQEVPLSHVAHVPGQSTQLVPPSK